MPKTDLIGQKFDMLTVLGRCGVNDNGAALWLCRCDCGREITLNSRQLRSGSKCDCGCRQRVREDLSGQRFGMLTVLELIGKEGGRYVKWRCRCDCGRETVVEGRLLHSGQVKSCGCRSYSNRAEQYIGQRFGRIVVIEKSDRRSNAGAVFVRCRCDCGNETEVNIHSLINGRTKSCGCLKKEKRTT